MSFGGSVLLSDLDANPGWALLTDCDLAETSGGHIFCLKEYDTPWTACNDPHWIILVQCGSLPFLKCLMFFSWIEPELHPSVLM
jgi:hypothetical protein